MDENSCPICQEKMILTQDRIDYTLCEELLVCPKGHYSYEYMYGAHRTRVGKKEFCWHYTDTMDLVHKMQSQIDTAVKHYRMFEDVKKWFVPVMTAIVVPFGLFYLGYKIYKNFKKKKAEK